MSAVGARAAHEPRDPDYAAKVRDSFGRQRIMAFLGAELTLVEPGHVRVELPYHDDLTQQHGFFHAGATSTIADTAGGYAGFSLMPPGSSILTVEFKLNLVAPADGERLVADGRVVRSGRTITVSELEVHAIKGGEARLCARGLQSLVCLENASDGPGE